MWEVPQLKKLSEDVVNKILAHTTKPKLAQYLHEALFSPTTRSLLKAIKYGFLSTWTGLTKNLIKNIFKKQ